MAIEATHLQTGRVYRFVTDGEGFLDGRVPGPLAAAPATFRLVVRDPGYRSDPLDIRVQVVDAAQPGYLVICDIDDTIAETGVTGSKVKLVARVAASNAADMRAYPGAAATLRAFVQAGIPVVYVTAGPVELAPRTTAFLDAHGFPEGALFMRHYEEDGIGSPLTFKRTRIDRLLADFPRRRLILIGDNGEADLTLFHQLAADTGRVASAYVRSTLKVTPGDPRYKGMVPFAAWSEVARHAGQVGFLRWMRAQRTAREH